MKVELMRAAVAALGLLAAVAFGLYMLTEASNLQADGVALGGNWPAFFGSTSLLVLLVLALITIMLLWGAFAMIFRRR